MKHNGATTPGRSSSLVMLTYFHKHFCVNSCWNIPQHALCASLCKSY